MVLEHGLAVGFLQALIANAISVLLETQDFVVGKLMHELGGEVVPKEEIDVLAHFLLFFVASGKRKYTEGNGGGVHRSG